MLYVPILVLRDISFVLIFCDTGDNGDIGDISFVGVVDIICGFVIILRDGFILG